MRDHEGYESCDRCGKDLGYKYHSTMCEPCKTVTRVMEQHNEAARKVTIAKVYEQYDRGLITSMELYEAIMQVALTVPKRNNAVLIVDVRLDPVPGTFYTAESARDSVQAILAQRIPHYDPIVTLQADDEALNGKRA